MPVYVLEGISSDEAVRIIAAEYCHRKEFSVLHTARIVGAAHETLQHNGQDAVPLRQLAAVLPLGRTSLGQYLVINEGMKDPVVGPLVHSVDKPSKAKLYKALSHVDVRTKVAALEAMQPQRARSSAAPKSAGGPPRKAVVRRRKRGRGFDLTVEVRPSMTGVDVGRALDALHQAIADVHILFPTAENATEAAAD